MAIKEKNNDIKDHKNKGILEHDLTEHLELQPSREGLRPRICASRLGHLRLCACGRKRALAKQGHHWRRLSGCNHCLRIPSATSRLIAMTSCKEPGNE
jgi:hypothetical protein